MQLNIPKKLFFLFVILLVLTSCTSKDSEMISDASFETYDVPLQAYYFEDGSMTQWNNEGGGGSGYTLSTDTGTPINSSDTPSGTGNAIFFDGGDALQFDSVLGMNEPETFQLSFAAKINTTDSTQIFSEISGLGMDNGRTQWKPGWNDSSENPRMLWFEIGSEYTPNGQWVYYTFEDNGSAINFYVNASLVRSENKGSSQALSISGTPRIGRDNSQFFNHGLMDCLSVDVNGTYNDSQRTFMFDTCFTAAPSDSCTYSSGNHTYQCSDNCALTEPVNTDAQTTIIINGSGTFTGVEQISGAKTIRVQGGCNAKV